MISLRMAFAVVVVFLAMAWKYNYHNCIFGLGVLGAVILAIQNFMDKSRVILTNRPVHADNLPYREEHDRKRYATYPHNPVANTWYHVCDSDELKNGKVIEVRALGHVFAVWRADDGSPVCHSAFCLHLGANLAVGGKVVDGCVECPFHKWKFDQHGCVKEIPYIKDQSKRPKTSKLKTYPCVDWCGLVCIYFHAEGHDPEFALPTWVPDQMTEEGWVPHMKWDVGFLRLTPTDWVDQAGDHAHFHTLHNTFLIPYTLIPLPDWLQRLVPVGITHQLATYKGDDPEWESKMKEYGMGSVDKHLIYFTDRAGISWKGKSLESTVAETLEMYIGPAMMSFHIPFTIGAFKAFVNTTPVEGGCVMRVRTWVDSRVKNSLFNRFIAWILVGISSSQLASDIDILENKIRLKRPTIVPFDGPYNRTSAWMRQFYSESSPSVGEGVYKNDW